MYQNGQEIHILSNHTSEQISLLNSRMRMPCQHSDDDNQIDSHENTRALRQFEREIQERFQMSVANKIYTFPKKILKIDDLISSDEQEPDGQDQNNNPFQAKYYKIKQKQKMENFQQPYKNFKKKEKQTYQQTATNNNFYNQRLKTQMQQTNYNVQPQQYKKNSKLNNKGVRQSKQKQKKEIQSKYPSHLLMNSQNNNNAKKRIQRLKTQADSSNSYLDTVRSKIKMSKKK